MRSPTRTAARGLLGAFALGVALGPVLGPAAPGSAAETPSAGASIDHAEPSGQRVGLLLSLPPGTDADLDRLEVTIDGKATRAVAARAADRSVAERTAVLALDLGPGLRGASLSAAQAAARTYLDTVPADVAVGVVAFGDDVATLLEPTTDREAARAALADLEPQAGTALYDGAVGAVEAAGTRGQRSVLLLSTGPDTTGTPLSAALREVQASGALLDVVALGQSGAAAAPLQLLAQQGRGTVVDATGPDDLAPALRDEAEALARQVAVEAEVPRGAPASAEVAVSLPSATGTVTAAATVPLRAGAGSDETSEDTTAQDARTDAAPARADSGTAAAGSAAGAPWQVSEIVALGAVGAIGLGLVGVLLVLAVVRKKPAEDEKLREQLQAYGVFGSTPSAQVEQAPDSVGDQVRGAAEKLLQGHAGLEDRIAARLEGAGSKLKPAEWLLAHGGFVVAGGTLGLLLGGGGLLLMLVGTVLGMVLPWVYLGFRRSRRLAAFSASLPDTLQLMSGSLSAGLSLAQSVDTIVREGGEPISSEFRRVVVEARLGVPFEDALAGVAERMGSKDFEWVVMAIKIQREVGGNLAELLLQVAATLREREYLRRHVRALSAEGRLSAWVLGGLPPGFLLYLTVTRRDYVQPMFVEPMGWAMLGGAVFLMVGGVVWMVKAGKVAL